MRTSWDEPVRRSRRSLSLRPSPYTSAVSKKLTPQSSARKRALFDSASSTSPHVPPIAHAPKLTVETFQPVRPSARYCIGGAYQASWPTGMRVLFVGGTGIISSACTKRAAEHGIDLTLV